MIKKTGKKKTVNWDKVKTALGFAADGADPKDTDIAVGTGGSCNVISSLWRQNADASNQCSLLGYAASNLAGIGTTTGNMYTFASMVAAKFDSETGGKIMLLKATGTATDRKKRKDACNTISKALVALKTSGNTGPCGEEGDDCEDTTNTKQKAKDWESEHTKILARRKKQATWSREAVARQRSGRLPFNALEYPRCRSSICMGRSLCLDVPLSVLRPVMLSSMKHCHTVFVVVRLSIGSLKASPWPHSSHLHVGPAVGCRVTAL
ncbi:hypothetical protein ERJ75_000561900 [Trypanosoma vivax]|uniref:Uncharacterized protein n=1 Tax=Trypanosoma vivax (strain Y486) TaxID=1055687 RepID=F9WRA6_TRYVY|nr:hypothetical protein TRVL_03673 [Trypanosoma vivax]KAH8615662.1 hypothetical protein ERJ75_000561900 [Trypanosoma vivax]CCD20090.1 hypothetical protein, conserved in T. vivax [Trypanosoma vivax Y486]|eukprot:CCD20090.1 hypothetical protein, conserved in T. vivax [Trypanosoma vivax Y486]